MIKSPPCGVEGQEAPMQLVPNRNQQYSVPFGHDEVGADSGSIVVLSAEIHNQYNIKIGTLFIVY